MQKEKPSRLSTHRESTSTRDTKESKSSHRKSIVSKSKSANSTAIVPLIPAEPSHERNEFLEDILQEEDALDVVYGIREELMERVMDEIYKIYLDKQTVRFIVQCAYEAMLKLLSIEFYYHPPVPDPLSPQWKPDEPIPPSPPDTWAARNIPIRRKPKEEISPDTLKTTEGDSPAVCSCQSSIQCICLVKKDPNLEASVSSVDKTADSSFADSDLFDQRLSSLGKSEQLYATSASASQQGRLTSKQKLRKKLKSISQSDTRGSHQTTDEAGDEPGAYFQFTAGKKREVFATRKSIRKATKEEIKLPKIELPTYRARDSKTSFVELPPIRAGGKFTVQPAEEKPDAKKTPREEPKKK